VGEESVVLERPAMVEELEQEYVELSKKVRELKEYL
jgi:hypothetical protein